MKSNKPFSVRKAKFLVSVMDYVIHFLNIISDKVEQYIDQYLETDENIEKFDPRYLLAFGMARDYIMVGDVYSASIDYMERESKHDKVAFPSSFAIYLCNIMICFCKVLQATDNPVYFKIFMNHIEKVEESLGFLANHIESENERKQRVAEALEEELEPHPFFVDDDEEDVAGDLDIEDLG